MRAAAIRRLEGRDRRRLLAMYRSFKPLGAAQGLPPATEKGRQNWIDRELRESLNWGVYGRVPALWGHAILAPSGSGDVEIAFFVHQRHRRKRLGTRLVKTALDEAREMDLERVWASILSDKETGQATLRGLLPLPTNLNVGLAPKISKWLGVRLSASETRSPV